MVAQHLRYTAAVFGFFNKNQRFARFRINHFLMHKDHVNGCGYLLHILFAVA
jgi:hypothetical protein